MEARLSQVHNIELEAQLSLAAYRYYGFLCRRMQQHSAPVLEFSNEEIAASTKILDPKTLARSRGELVSFGLITAQRVPPGVFSHTMLDEEGKPIPAPKARRGIRRYE